MKIYYLYLFLGVIFLLDSLLVKSVYAWENINDEFNSPLSTNIWTSLPNGGSVSVEGGLLKLRAPSGRTYPYVYTNMGVWPINDFIFETRFKMFGPSYGIGVNLTDFLLTNGTSNNLSRYDAIFVVWLNSNSTFSIYSRPCPEQSVCDTDEYGNSPIGSGLWNQWYILKVVKTNNIYDVFLNNSQILHSKPSLRSISTVWFGNPQRTNTTQLWGGIDIDYVRVEAISVTEPTPTPIATPTPTAIPTPTPTPARKPIVIIPGHGASWDYPAILTGTAGTNWQVPSWVKVYDNLIASLTNAGYTLNQDLFVFAYDWRKNLAALKTDFTNYVNSHNFSNGFKIVAHSYGGLIARTYMQSNPTNLAEILVTLGTPNQGIVVSYGSWEGAEVWDRSWWQRIALETLLEFNRLPSETRTNAIRRMSPSIKDVLPVFNYLISDGNGSEIQEGTMNQRNLYLRTLNENYLNIDPLTHVIYGNGINTLKELRVKQRNWLDTALGLWEDGKPVLKNYANEGDNSVLAARSFGPFSQYFEKTLDHTDLVSRRDSLETVFSQLGLNQDLIAQDSFMSNTNKVLIALLRSPGELTIVNENNIPLPQTISIPEARMLIVPEIGDGNYKLQVDEAGETGNYVLHFAVLNESGTTWHSLGSKITLGDADTFPIIINFEGMTLDTENPQLDVEEILATDIDLLEAKINLWDGALKIRGLNYLTFLREAINQRFFNQAKENLIWINYLSVSFGKEAEEIITNRLLEQLSDLTINQTHDSDLWAQMKDKAETTMVDSMINLEARGYFLKPAEAFQKGQKMIGEGRYFDGYLELIQAQRY